jgi:hypothetical protein
VDCPPLARAANRIAVLLAERGERTDALERTPDGRASPCGSRKAAFVKAKLGKFGGDGIKVTKVVSGDGTEMASVCTLDLTGTRNGADPYGVGAGAQPCHKF